MFFLLPVLMVGILLLGGTILALVVGFGQYRATKNMVYALGWGLGLMVSALALSASVVWAFVQAEIHTDEGDWSYGSMDSFKTPLGGGFYLLSIDTPKDLPLPLYQRSATASAEYGNDSQIDMAQALACTAGTVSVKTSHDVLVIDRQKRTLSRVNTPQGQHWLNLAEFDKTPCAQPPASEQYHLPLAVWTGPALAAIILLALLAWRPRMGAAA